MCSAVEEPQDDHTRWWGTHSRRDSRHQTRLACSGVSGMSASRSEHAQRPQRDPRGGQVCIYSLLETRHLHNTILRWLYALFIVINANFRLKLKARGIKDPELGSGWTYFVEQVAYEKHVRKHFDEKDVSCLDPQKSYRNLTPRSRS